jgi:hypothetical protein
VDETPTWPSEEGLAGEPPVGAVPEEEAPKSQRQGRCSLEQGRGRGEGPGEGAPKSLDPWWSSWETHGNRSGERRPGLPSGASQGPSGEGPWWNRTRPMKAKGSRLQGIEPDQESVQPTGGG